MKIWPMIILAAACGCATPNLRVGIISDSQSYATAGDPGLKKTELALKLLQKKNIDLLLIAGDIADKGDKEVYVRYREMFKRIFRERIPYQIAIMGNHDFWNDLPPETSRQNFAENINQTSPDVHLVINDYDFIGLSPEDGECHGKYTQKSVDFMEYNMEYAVRRDSERPIFVVTHQHPGDTVYGSTAWGNGDIAAMLKKYPQVISFSGHSHYPLEDERSIFQENFTAVGTSSLSYCEMEEGKVNGSVPPNSGECVQLLYMEIFDTHIDFYRYNVLTGKEIKPNNRWRVELPLTPANGAYTAKREEERSEPYFSYGAEIDVTVDDNVTISFDAAKHDDFVHSYALTLFPQNKDNSAATPKELLYFSDFYLGLEKMSSCVTFTLPNKELQSNTTYTLEITPIESFGKRGRKTLQTKFTTGNVVIPPEEASK